MLQQSHRSQNRIRIYMSAGVFIAVFSTVMVLAQTKKKEVASRRNAQTEAAVNAIDPRNFLKPANTKLLADGSLVYTNADHMLALEPNLGQWLDNHLHYPDAAVQKKEEGKVIVAFIVNTDGKLSAPAVVSSSGHSTLDEEALRIVREMPAWRPGATRDGQKVPVQLNLPINFKLNAQGKPEAFGGC